jgi:hypothetical protein
MVSELVKAQSDMDGKMNRRSTEQRELILETIQGADKHLDADEIYQLALVCTLPVPVVVKPQIKHFKGGKKHVAVVRILASLEMGMA